MIADALNALAEPWREPLIWRAFLEIALLGVAGGALGCWVLLYNLAYSAESLAHTLLPGLVLAALAGVPLILGGAVGILVGALAVALAARVPAIGRDTAVAIVVSTLFGLGVLLALSPSTPAGLQGLLFGDILGVATSDLVLAAALAVGLAGALRLLHGRLLLVGFDRASAGSLGASPALVDAALLVLVAAAILVAVQGLGTLLVVAVLVAPAAAARALTRRMAPMMLLSAAGAVTAGIAGLYVSFYAQVAAGASIALAFVLMAALGSAARPVRRRLARAAAGDA